MTQQYSLRWNNHQPNFISMFGSLLATKNLVDVTLAAEGQHLVAHKVVLSACSTYFHSLFVDNPSPHPIVILKDVTFNNLCTMVDFMYYGEVNVTEEQLPQVLETAKILKIKGLTEMPDSTSLTRSQGATSDFANLDTSSETLRPLSPTISPTIRRKRRRVSSTGSVVNLMTEDNRSSDCGQNMELMRDAVTLSSVPQQKRRDLEERVDNQTGEPSNINIDQLALDTNAVGMTQGQWSMLEHTYPRYPNACLGGGGFQTDQGMYLNNVINQHGDPDMNHYGQTLGVTGPTPGTSCVAEAQPNPMQQINPPPQRRRRQTNPQDGENFQKALEAVRVGGIGFCKAARLFGVNNRTLWLEYKKKGYPNNRPSIRSRIKREHITPPPQPEHVDEPQQRQQNQQMSLVCPPHSVPVGFIESRPVEFPLQDHLASSSGVKMRRSKYFKRQSRVQPDEREVRKQVSEPMLPAYSAAVPVLQKHESYPQYSTSKVYRPRPRSTEQAVGSLLIRAVAVVNRQSLTTATTTTTNTFESIVSESVIAENPAQAHRASHTPAVRSGPPLSCNFCWNTVDECGRILRRKTQYHCPECRTNLCIVPCFHEYHDGPEADTSNIAR